MDGGSIVQQAVGVVYNVLLPLTSPLCRVPGLTSYAVTKWRLALDDYKGTRTRAIHGLHSEYGTAVRISPNEISFSSLSALRTIYGAGSGFERTDFYRMFDVYGRQNLFTFAESKKHGDRKKILAHAYSKSNILSPAAIAKPLIEGNAKSFLNLIEQEKDVASEIFHSLHWFSLDSITGFLYGNEHGGTHALRGNESDRAMLNDILDPARRKLTWYAVHLKAYTRWLYSQTGVLGSAISALNLLPMKRPATYTSIRAHALKSWTDFESDVQSKDLKPSTTAAAADSMASIMAKLWKHSTSGKAPALDGLDIASEVADHFLAGIDTTSDTLMFAIWALSLPENKKYQDQLIAEVDSLITADDCNADGIPTVQAVDRLPFLDAVIKETLRLFAPLPASEPRSLPTDTAVDGYLIPAGTVVSISPYTLHRNAEVFPHPLEFRPERWLGELGDVAEMKKWFWAFSSGGRMCIGMHLAMAEMTTLLTALYREYTTTEQERQKGSSPAITSRFEVFYDEKYERISEHACYIDFHRR
ncbi:putative benzoate 4-monooxygenase cytochrome P450 [Microdochium trichocladiopsis]|uniref:Benzoate 4-monooxygenase cytochrome P450 n=1 Tax=Microdochium trichocladiopsis TaxID=1682393 RepID=A0A9P9BL09_9PEZI|nr:putative benzoate 4-monooxygenase cytochrome P450 [Microdochium trichocladiopsis]KAH7024414.1 putative benzoate 4-monooxygenase cytochrome P450 [Microdochium trichocladiopsis]